MIPYTLLISSQISKFLKFGMHIDNFIGLPLHNIVSLPGIMSVNINMNFVARRMLK